MKPAWIEAWAHIKRGNAYDAKGERSRAVAEYNKAVRYFPTNVTAKYILGLSPRATFTADEKAATPPAVKF